MKLQFRKQRFASLLSLSLLVILLLSSLPQTQAGNSQVTVSFVGEQQDGNVSLDGIGSYFSKWNATEGSVVLDNDTLFGVGQNYNFALNRFTIWRAFLFFDTSSLSSSASLVSAALNLSLAEDDSLSDFVLTVQAPSTEHPNSIQLQMGDYWREYYSGNFGSFNTSAVEGASDGDNFEFAVDTNLIISGDLTRLVLRSDNDINGRPPVSKQYLLIYDCSIETPENFKPILTVTYVVEGAAGGPREDDWVPLSIPNIPLHARRVLEWVQQMIREHEQLRAVIGLGLIMVVGGVIIKWDRKGKRKLL